MAACFVSPHSIMDSPHFSGYRVHGVRNHNAALTSMMVVFKLQIFNKDQKNISSLIIQPRPQGLLAFQNGGGSGEDPGT